MEHWLRMNRHTKLLLGGVQTFHGVNILVVLGSIISMFAVCTYAYEYVWIFIMVVGSTSKTITLIHSSFHLAIAIDRWVVIWSTRYVDIRGRLSWGMMMKQIEEWHFVWRARWKIVSGGFPIITPSSIDRVSLLVVSAKMRRNRYFEIEYNFELYVIMTVQPYSKCSFFQSPPYESGPGPRKTKVYYSSVQRTNGR